ncbi:putative RNA methylase [Leucobacter luti]|uniref:Ig-like domain-containing protein n=1 Tax=Leucobacter luti TaxID=340320 RepID=UPI002225FB3F|nr:invasin domain 3-containing protein [Leucobacter luti]MCW2286981.1 putative RNA methylase [Leucobacter luti]
MKLQIPIISNQQEGGGRADARRTRTRAAAFVTTFFFALSLLVTNSIAFSAAPAQAAGSAHGTEISTVSWPNDANLAANGIWSLTATGVVGTHGGTPTTQINYGKGLFNLGVSANAVNPGLYTMSVAAPVVSAKSAALAGSYADTPSFTNSFNVEWAPATSNGAGAKGKSYAIEIPTSVTALTTCGIEVNPLTSELIIFHACETGLSQLNKVTYFSPGPDGDPLTLADNAVQELQLASSPANNGVSDITLDAAGNLYTIEDGNTPAIWRWDRTTGKYLMIASATAYSAANGAAAPANVGLAFWNGLVVNTSAAWNSLSLGVNPLSKTSAAIPGSAWSSTIAQTGLVPVLDGAGTSGAVGFEGVVTDTGGSPIAGQTIAIYRDNADGTATLAGVSSPTDSAGKYAIMLDSTEETFYFRLVQPKLTTGTGAAQETKNGEVVSIDPGFAFGASATANAIGTVNDRDNGVNPAAGTVGTTKIDVTADGLNDLVKYDVADALAVGKADFTVKFAGSTADRRNNSLLTTDATSGLGPQHVSAGDQLRVGATVGEFTVGSTNNGHASDDGVLLKLAGQRPALNNQLLAKGKAYQLRVDTQGTAVADAKTSAWSTTPVANNADTTARPWASLTPFATGTGADVVLDYTAAATNGFSTVRVNSSLTAATKPTNADGEYAASDGSRPWATLGEIEDHNVQTVDAVSRLSVDSPVAGSYGYSLTNTSATAPSSTTATVSVTSGRTSETGVHSVTTAGSAIEFTQTAAPAGAKLVSAQVVDSVSGAALGTGTISKSGGVTKITVAGALVAAGSDVRLLLTYGEDVDPSQSTFVLDPASVPADGASQISAVVTLRGASGAPVSGESVKIAAVDASAPLTASGAVQDNGDGTYSVTFTSSVAGIYPLQASVSIGGTDVAVGSKLDATFTVGAVDAGASSWEISPSGSQTVGSDFTAKATLRDAHDNLVPGGTVEFIVPAGVNGATAPTPVTVTANPEGVATLVLNSTVAGTYSVAAHSGGDPIGGTATRQIHYTAGDPSLADGASQFAVSTGDRIADNSDEHDAIATLVDEYGNPVAGIDVTFELPAGVNYRSATSGTWASGTTGSIVVTTDAAGVAAVSVATATAGSYEVAAAIDAGALPGSPAEVTFVAGAADASASSWTVTPSSAPADVDPQFTATIQVNDAHGNPVAAGTEVLLGLPANIAGATSGVTDVDGVVTIPLQSTVKGIYNITATVAGSPVGGTSASGTAEIEVTAGAPSASHSTLTATTGVQEADGVATHTATAAIRDQWDNLVEAGTEVTFSLPAKVNGNTDNTQVTVATAADGRALIDLTTTTTGDYEIAAALGTAAITDSPVTVQFGNGAASAEHSSWTITPGSAQAAGETFVATAIVRDAHDNVVADEVVTFAFPAAVNGGALVATGTTDPNGEVSFDLRATLVGSYEISARVGGNQIGGPDGALEIEYIAGPADLEQSTITASKSPIDADGVDESVITVQLRDAFGNDIQDATDTVTITTDRGTITATTSGANEGSYIATLVGGPAAAGSAHLGFSLNGVDATATAFVQLRDVTDPAPPVVTGTDGGVVTGTAEPDSKVEIRNPDTGEVVCETVADAEGNFSCGPVVDGEYEVVAVDPDGNVSEPTPVVVDTTAPEAPVVDSTDGGVVTGTAEPDSKVEIRNPDTGEVVCETVADAEGNFSCGPVVDGEYEVVAVDPDGNVSEPTPVVVDTTAPEAPVVDSTDGGVVTGTAEPDSKVEIRNPDTGEVVCETVADAEGNFSCGPVVDGEYEVVAVDPDGNVSEPTPVVVDTTAPEAPVVDSTDGGVVTGTAEPDSKVEIRNPDTGEVVCETVADAEGNFSCGPVVDGEYEVVAVDPDGNVSEPTPVVVDTTAPEAPVVDSTDGGVVTGTAEPGSTVKIKDRDGKVLCTTQADDSGHFACTLEHPVKNGELLQVTATDAHGNESAATWVRVAGPYIELSKDSLTPGETLIVTGHGFLPEEVVAGRIESDPIQLGEVAADANGDVEFTFVVPDEFELGAHTAFLLGDASGEVDAGFTVVKVVADAPVHGTTPHNPGLAITGGVAVVLPLTVLALALVAGGIVLVLKRRKRDDEEVHASGV